MRGRPEPVGDNRRQPNGDKPVDTTVRPDVPEEDVKEVVDYNIHGKPSKLRKRNPGLNRP